MIVVFLNVRTHGCEIEGGVVYQATGVFRKWRVDGGGKGFKDYWQGVLADELNLLVALCVGKFLLRTALTNQACHYHYEIPNSLHLHNVIRTWLFAKSCDGFSF